MVIKWPKKEDPRCQIPFFYPIAGRKQFARHEWAQKAAYLLGCSLEELSSAIFKHQHKGGTLQRSTSFRQGPEESGLGDGTGTLSPLAGGCDSEASSRAHCCLWRRETAGVNRCFPHGERPAPGPHADLALGGYGAHPGGDSQGAGDRADPLAPQAPN